MSDEPRGIVLQHAESDPPGLFGEWAAARGIALTVHRTDLGEPMPELDGHAFLATLGSRYNPTDTNVPEVAAEHAYVRGAIERGTPVLGLCFGGQMLAAALGGTVEPSPEPEIGWYEIDTHDPDLVPAGPWLEWHYHRFTAPPGAEVVATSPVSVQAFTHGRHLGVQFHPESTVEIVRNWARSDHERLVELGIDGEARIDGGARHAQAAERAAFQLFDGFWSRAQS